MPGQEELAMRLQALEDSYNNDKRVARENQFMSDYGNMFSNHPGLGRAIMAELDVRGIDTSAAGEAVTEIIDELRSEVNELSALINAVQETVENKAEKVDELADMANKAIAENPDSTIEPEPEPMPMPEEPMPEEPMDMLAGDPNAEFVPQEEPMDMSAGDPNAEFVPQEEPVPDINSQFTVSDARMKKVRANLSARRAARKPVVSGYKPSSGILNAAMGGKD